MKNPFVPNSPDIKVSRNAFDRSQKAVFGASIGELLPFFTMDVIGGSHVRLQNQSFSRTQPVNTAAFSRLSENFEYFFVPYRLLWSYWNAFRTNVSDENSTVLQTEGDRQDGYPTWTPWDAAENPTLPNEIPLFSFNEAFARYNNTEGYIPSTAEDVKPASSYNDSLGMFGIPFRYGAYKLFNLLEYGQLDADKQYIEQLSTHFDYNHDYWLNPFRLCAYQKIFADHYRLTEFVPNNNFSYNLDYWSTEQGEMRSMRPGLISYEILDNLFELHYRPLKKDFFTGVRPYTYWYGQTNDNGNWLDSLLLPNSFYAKSIIGELDYSIEDDVAAGVNPAPYIFNAQSTRLQFILERLQRVQALTPKHYDAQLEALFGYKPKTGLNESIRIGSFSNQVLIDEITANVTTDDTVKGSVAGKGVSMGNHGRYENEALEFDVPEDGIIMGIYSISPIADYPSYGVNPFNTKSINNDYYNPSFDTVGPHVLRQMTKCFVPALNNLNNKVVGLQTPYLEYKTSIDKVFGDFNPNQTMCDWVSPRKEGFFGRSDTPRPDITPETELTVSDLLVNPRDYDSIFAMEYNGQEYSNQFIVNGYTQVQAVQDMSVTGEPYGLTV